MYLKYRWIYSLNIDVGIDIWSQTQIQNEIEIQMDIDSKKAYIMMHANKVLLYIKAPTNCKAGQEQVISILNSTASQKLKERIEIHTFLHVDTSMERFVHLMATSVLFLVMICSSSSSNQAQAVLPCYFKILHFTIIFSDDLLFF